MQISSTSEKYARFEPATVAIILLAMGIVMWLSSSQMSPTFDEPVHVLAGVVHLQKHDTRLNPEHPPLMKTWSALPVVASIHPDYQDRAFCAYGACEWVFMRSQLGRPELQSWIMRARFMMILIAMMTGFVLYTVARRIGGVSGAMLALISFATSPFFLGYGPLVLNDVLLALMVLCVCITTARVVEKPSAGSIIWMA